MNYVTQGRAGFMVLGAFGLYAVLAAIMPVEMIKDIFNPLSFGVSFLIMWTWGDAAIKAWSDDNVAPADKQVLTGIALIETVLTLQRLYAIVFNWLGNPEWLRESFISGVWGYSFFVTGLLFLLSPGTARPELRKRSLWTALIGIGIGGLLAGILIGMNVPSE